MLKDSDLQTFQNLCDRAVEVQSDERSPSDHLAADLGPLFSSEIWRLSKSLQIAAVCGLATIEQARIATEIVSQIGNIRCLDFESIDAWTCAISRVRTLLPPHPSHQGASWFTRQQQVGLACSRLRAAGYNISVGAYGPDLSQDDQRRIGGILNDDIAQLGGNSVLNHVCGTFQTSNLIHDDFWLMGNTVPGYLGTARPAIPWGWLMSLALRNLKDGDPPGDAQALWTDTIQLATDVASVFDCQRYESVMTIGIPPSEIYQSYKESLIWKELFTLPQVPPKFLSVLLAALFMQLTAADLARMKHPFPSLAGEICQLASLTLSSNTIKMAKADVILRFPLLSKIALGPIGGVNDIYCGPLHDKSRNQDRFVMFEEGSNYVIALPGTFMAASACGIIFEVVRSALNRDRFETIMGSTLETAIEICCKGKTSTVIRAKEYEVGKSVYEIDVATRDQSKIVLFEVKSKSLTAKAREGDMIAYFNDYSDSYLYLLKQLARNDRFVREGKTPLGRIDDLEGEVHTLKVAVSPLTYGSVSDKVFASSLLLALADVTFQPVSDNPEHRRVISKLNRRKIEALEQINEIAPRQDGLIDLHAYLMDVFWLDLGQLFYVNDRSLSIFDALAPLKNITWSSRDFWTEIAQADRLGVTAGRWRPIARK